MRVSPNDAKYVKGEGLRFNRSFGSGKWAIPMSISVQA